MIYFLQLWFIINAITIAIIGALFSQNTKMWNYSSYALHKQITCTGHYACTCFQPILKEEIGVSVYLGPAAVIKIRRTFDCCKRSKAPMGMRVISAERLFSNVARRHALWNAQQYVWILERDRSTATCASESKKTKARRASGRKSADPLAVAAWFAKSIFVKVAGLWDTICILTSS